MKIYKIYSCTFKETNGEFCPVTFNLEKISSVWKRKSSIVVTYTEDFHVEYDCVDENEAQAFYDALETALKLWGNG
jgi:hypothetical protein